MTFHPCNHIEAINEVLYWASRIFLVILYFIIAIFVKSEFKYYVLFLLGFSFGYLCFKEIKYNYVAEKYFENIDWDYYFNKYKKIENIFQNKDETFYDLYTVFGRKSD